MFSQIGSIPDLRIDCKFGDVIEGRCYRAIDHEVTWETAQSRCELFGSDLAEISHEILNIKLITYLNGKAGHYWIGLRRNDTIGLYEWRSGSVLIDSFDPWKDGNDPKSNSDNSTNCAEMHGDKWLLKECNNNRPYLCQSSKFQIYIKPLFVRVRRYASQTTTMTLSASLLQMKYSLAIICTISIEYILPFYQICEQHQIFIWEIL